MYKREFNQQRRRRLRKRPGLITEVALHKTLSRLLHLVPFVKCWQFSLELNSKRLYLSSGKEKESRCLVFTVFTSSEKRGIRQFHVVVVHWRQRNVQKSMMHVQSCCLANLNQFLFCRSRWRRRRRYLSFLISYTKRLQFFVTNLSRFVVGSVQYRDHLRSRIICSPFWGSFAVLFSSHPCPERSYI